MNLDKLKGHIPDSVIAMLPETIEKLEILKQKIIQGFDSPQSLSVEIFGVNIFIYDEKKYRELYPYLYSRGLE